MNATGSQTIMAAFWVKRLHVWVRLPALVGRANPHFLHVFIFTGEKDCGGRVLSK